MKYTGSLVKKEREQIFEQFLHNDALKFSDIEKSMSIRSNMIAYHLSQMEKEGLIRKSNANYSLTVKGEKFIPMFSHIIGAELSPLPIALVAVINNGKILLIKRNKRPYKNYWSMIGGKIRFEEDYVSASLRLVKDRTGIDAKFVSINSILHEKVMDEGIKHSFILFFTKVNAKETKIKTSQHGELRWFTLKSLGKIDIIPSDHWLMKKKLNSKIKVFNATMQDDTGKLSSFNIVD